MTDKKKPRGKPFTKNDPRRSDGVKGGKVTNAGSITYWARTFAAMSPAELANTCALFARDLKRGGDELPIAALIAVRALMELMNDPDPRLLSQVLDRIDGKVTQPIDVSWRDEAVKLGYDPDQLVNQFITAMGAGADDSGSAEENTTAQAAAVTLATDAQSASRN